MTFIGITMRKVNSSTTGSRNFPPVPGFGSETWPSQRGVGHGQPVGKGLQISSGSPPRLLPSTCCGFSFMTALTKGFVLDLFWCFFWSRGAVCPFCSSVPSALLSEHWIMAWLLQNFIKWHFNIFFSFSWMRKAFQAGTREVVGSDMGLGVQAGPSWSIPAHPSAAGDVSDGSRHCNHI